MSAPSSWPGRSAYVRLPRRAGEPIYPAQQRTHFGPVLVDHFVPSLDIEDWAGAIEAFLVVLRAAGRPKSTLYLRGYQLRRVAAAMLPRGPWEVPGPMLVAWLGSQDWGPETRRSWRSALRGFYGWAVEAGHIEKDPSRAVPSIRPADPDPRPAPEHAYRIARAGADERVRLMLRLAAELGLRRGEVARAHSDDLERDSAGWKLRVVGKGGRVRRLPLTIGQAAAIRTRAPSNGYLFPGKIDGHLSPAWVGKLVSRALPGIWTTHSLRHRFGTAAFAVDRDLLTVQELLGHASPVTTRRYVLTPEEAARNTVARVAEL